MHFTSVFIDRGYPSRSVPGFPRFLSMSSFPFWGEYYLVDFAVYNTAITGLELAKTVMVCGRETRKQAVSALSRWDRVSSCLVTIDPEIDFCSELDASIETDLTIIYDINNASLISEKGKMLIHENINSNFSKKNYSEIIKLSIDNVPVDIYIISKDNLLKIARKYNKPGTLIDQALTETFDKILDVEGDVFFNSTVMQLYDNNIMLLNPEHSNLTGFFLSSAPYPAERDSFIIKKGMVVNSIISSNVRIEGYVENSVIFSDVVIKPNARVINSVIMNGNQIGRDSQITNSLIFPNFKNTAGISNIQEKAFIGGSSKKTVNSDYPDQILNGLTVVGSNSAIPKNFILENGSYLAADIPVLQLKKAGKIARGRTME